MNPPRRPRDIIDAIEAIAAERGNIEAVDADYYRDFINLTQAQVEKLAVAIMLEHDREVRRLAVTEPKNVAVTRVSNLVQSTMLMLNAARLSAHLRSR